MLISSRDVEPRSIVLLFFCMQIDRIAEWEKSWKSAVVEAFERNLFHLKQKEMRMHPDLSTLHPFLQVLPQEAYVDAIMREIRRVARSSDAFSISLPYVYFSLGNHIFKKYEFHKKKEAKVTDSIARIYDRYLQWYIRQDPDERIVNGRVKWQQLAQEVMKAGLCPDMTVPEWPRHVLINVGKFLYNIIVNDVKIPYGTKAGAPERLMPAFYLLFRNQSAYLTEEIKPHPHLHRVFSDSHPETLTFDTVLLPTRVPPRPWINANTGGYLFSRTDFVRDPHMGVRILCAVVNTRVLRSRRIRFRSPSTIRSETGELDVLCEKHTGGAALSSVGLSESARLDTVEDQSACPGYLDRGML